MLTTAVLVAGLAIAQLPAEKPPQPQPQPQAQTPAPRRAAPARPAAGRQTLTIFVTDRQGRPLEGATVTATGPMEREGTTDADGNVLLRNVGAGTYRLRFEHPASITLEREITVGTRPIKMSAELSPAPPPPPAPPKPEPAAAPPAPPPPPPSGPRKSLSIPDFVEKNYVGNSPSKMSPVGCTGTSTATLLQLRDPLAEHSHDDADEMLYVVAGEGIERIGGVETNLTAGTFAVLPRGTPHSITRRGNRPIILLSILTGPPCQPAK
jgi:mannose-6-phosphate isomerase-like protein (cupin superfamily)